MVFKGVAVGLPPNSGENVIRLTYVNYNCDSFGRTFEWLGYFLYLRMGFE